MRHTLVTDTVKPGTFVAGAEDRHEHPTTPRQPELIGDYRTFANS